MYKTYRRSLSSAGNGHRQRCRATAAPPPTSVTVVMLMMKMRLPWMHTVSRNQTGSDSVNEFFNNHRNGEEIVRETRVVGRQNTLKKGGYILKVWNQEQNFSCHLQGQKLTLSMENSECKTY